MSCYNINFCVKQKLLILSLSLFFILASFAAMCFVFAFLAISPKSLSMVGLTTILPPVSDSLLPRYGTVDVEMTQVSADGLGQVQFQYYHGSISGKHVIYIPSVGSFMACIYEDKLRDRELQHPAILQQVVNKLSAATCII